jgi:conjugal transfer pilin signal peptidase TrbI
MAPIDPDLRAPSAAPLPRFRRFALWAGLGAAALSLMAAHDFSKDHLLLLNASPSLPNWAFWVERHKQPVRGDYVFFLPPRSALLIRHFGNKPHLFGKRVMGVAGDMVTRAGNAVAVNGHIVARLKPKTMRGETLVPGPLGWIPDHCAFVATRHKDGFDSRYAAIGWVCAPQIVGVGRPIL